ncbi:hypothetical protein J6590_055123 [Homalodisca vitripennis]|nr:hypothetical protein J6590_055123 [Homalodisca vitripennis]
MWLLLEWVTAEESCSSKQSAYSAVGVGSVKPLVFRLCRKGIFCIEDNQIRSAFFMCVVWGSLMLSLTILTLPSRGQHIGQGYL